MEEKKKMSAKNNNNVKAKITMPEVKEEPKLTEEEVEQRNSMNVHGWNSAMECANDLWGSIHASLLNGNLVFAYKSTSGSSSELGQIVIVQNINYQHDFAVGMMTTGYSMLLPHVPYEYLDTIVVEDLKRYKVEPRIRNIYQEIIEDFKPNQRTNGNI